MKRSVILKIALTALGLSLVATAAPAISRYQSTSMTCAAIWARINAEGAVILRWTQAPNIPRYDRFVAHNGYCPSFERAEPTYVPASDRDECVVLKCKQRYEQNELFDFLVLPLPR